MIAYRSDIDGLRAVAVIPVVLFHAGVPGFGGGFTGVDIFFVISGYLITGIVLKDVREGGFSFTRFYARRFGRILPALLAVCISTMAAGFFVLLPNELEATGLAGRYVAVFLSNYLFFRQADDYWAQNELAAQPFLHTWSLAIEEQFYIALPILLIAAVFLARRFRSGALLAVLVGLVLLGSFCAAVHMTSISPTAAFYLLAARAWELALGSMLAVFAIQGKAELGRWGREIAGLAGFVLIALSLFFLSKETLFPGMAALLPTLGAMLVILAGMGPVGAGRSTVTRMLSVRPLVLIGLVSYSLYLWHWPVLVMVESAGWYAYGLPRVPVPLALVAIVVLALLSYWYVETPARRWANAARPGRTIVASIGALIFLAGASQLFIGIASESDPVAQPLPPLVRQLAQDIKVPPGMACEGSKDPAVIRDHGGGCRVGRNDLPPVLAILGDSHARMWMEGVNDLGGRQGWSGLLMARSGCIPVLEIARPRRNDCHEIVDASIDFLAGSESIDTVVLTGYWIRQTDWMFDGQTPHPKGEEGLLVLERALEKTVLRLMKAGKRVIVSLDVPELANRKIPHEAALASMKGQGQAIYGQTRPEHDQRQSRFTRILHGLQEKHGFDIRDPARLLCDERCIVAENGRTYYYDRNHLTDIASVRFQDFWSEIAVTADRSIAGR